MSRNRQHRDTRKKKQCRQQPKKQCGNFGHVGEGMIYTGPGTCYICFKRFQEGDQATLLHVGDKSFNLCTKCAREVRADTPGIIHLGHLN